MSLLLRARAKLSTGKAPQRHCHDVEAALVVVPPTCSSELPGCLFPQVMLPRQLASISCHAHA
eukprot:4570645-Pyramimonas_sp.AAC.1